MKNNKSKLHSIMHTTCLSKVFKKNNAAENFKNLPSVARCEASASAENKRAVRKMYNRRRTIFSAALLLRLSLKDVLALDMK